jgi:pimeloyl-ACP methyl ester carboxylesterase
MEWKETASWLTERHRVFAPEARGHGRSERCPRDLSRAAHVADVARWIQDIAEEPVMLVGQSLGGHTAFLVGARHPDLVAKLVVVEATPERDPEAPQKVREWLESWPVPFASRDGAVAFFGRNDAWSKAWAGGLEQREGGLWPSFEIDVMVESLRENATDSYWDEWRSITCPTMVVVAQTDASPPETRRMLDEQPHARLVAIPDAGHDLHLDNPAAWRQALVGFTR